MAEQELAEIEERIKKELGIVEPPEPKKAYFLMADHHVRVLASQQVDENAKRFDQDQLELEKRVKFEKLKAVFAGRSRYTEAHLNNYKITCPAQQAAADEVKAYRSELKERIEGGCGMLLFGPPGTGKDHLMAYLIHCAVLDGKAVKWVNGMDLFGDARDRMDDDRKTERSFVDGLMSPAVLAISDPLPPVGMLTPYQSALLFRIIDARYSARMATWMTLNVKDDKEAEDRIGAATVDRLTDGALVIPCNWPSHRKPRVSP